MSHQPVLHLADQLSAYGATQSDTLNAHISARLADSDHFVLPPEAVGAGPIVMIFALIFHLCGYPFAVNSTPES